MWALMGDFGKEYDGENSECSYTTQAVLECVGRGHCLAGRKRRCSAGEGYGEETKTLPSCAPQPDVKCDRYTGHLDRCICLMRRRQWHPTPVLLPGESHGRRSLVGYSPWGH